MAGVINKTARQIDLRFRVKNDKNLSIVKTVTLNPGFNVVNDEAWRLSCENKIVQSYLAGGALVGNAKQSREDELMKKKVRDEAKIEVYQMERKAGVASVIPGDARPISHLAVAKGAGPGGRDIVENNAQTLSDDLLG